MSQNPPRLTVVIPAYNAAQFIGETLDVVCSSTLRDLEVICIDDGSTDATVQVVNDRRAKDPRINLITQDHLYAGAARNAGIDAAQGTYIHFLDADDLVDPAAYEPWLAYADEYGADVVECLYTNIDAPSGSVVDHGSHFDRASNLGPTVLSLDKNPKALAFGNVVPWNKIYRRDFLIDNGIRFDNLICAEDRSFFFAVIHDVGAFVRVPERWITHRVNVSTSLDGSDIRSRHFEVHFQSFERIWQIVSDAPESVKRYALESCIVDSLYYFKKTIGTEYEQRASDMIYEQWAKYLPLLGDEVLDRFWYGELFEIIVAHAPEGYRQSMRALYARQGDDLLYRTRMQRLRNKLVNTAADATRPLRKRFKR